MILDVSMKPNRYHDNVASEASHASIENNYSSPRMTSRHTLVMAHAKRPGDVHSFYADVECEQFVHFNVVYI